MSTEPARKDTLQRLLDSLDTEQKSTLLRRYVPKATASAPARGWKAYALAASVLLAIGGGVYWYAQMRAPFTATYVTAKAENRELSLPDGTRVTLGAGSRLDVSFTAQERAVRLQDGEVYFAVEHSGLRPFVVRVGDLHVTDIGTDFDVRKSGSHVTVTVSEGIVDVRRDETAKPLAPTTPASGGTYRLLAGDQMRVSPQQDRPTIARVDTQRTASWRGGRLDFQDEPLAVVVASVNRYAEHELVIVDPEVTQMRFTGTVFPDRIQDWLAGTSHLFGLRTEEAADGRVLLYSRP